MKKLKAFVERIIRSILEPLVAKVTADLDAKLRSFDLATTAKLAAFDADIRSATSEAFEVTLGRVTGNFRTTCETCKQTCVGLQRINHQWHCTNCLLSGKARF